MGKLVSSINAIVISCHCPQQQILNRSPVANDLPQTWLRISLINLRLINLPGAEATTDCYKEAHLQ